MQTNLLTFAYHKHMSAAFPNSCILPRITMPFYYNLHKHDKTFSAIHAQRTAQGLLTLKKAFKEEEVPERKRASRLLLATWNIREFESAKYGPRQREALYYIAEIIDHFDIVAVQEVRDDLSSLEKVMDILGGQWEYLLTDVTAGTQGNKERWRLFTILARYGSVV